MKNLALQTYAVSEDSRTIYSLRRDSHLDLIAELRPLLGYPRYREELVINFYNNDDLRLTLTRRGLEWSWTEGGSKREAFDFDKTRRSGSAGLANLKDKLVFFARWGGNECNISRVPVFEFPDNGDGALEIRPAARGRATAALLTRSRADELRGPSPRFSQEVLPIILKYSHKEPYEPAIAASWKDDAVIRWIGGRPLLDTAILEFCASNGITTHLEGPKTHRNLLESKDNDYGRYEETFARLTGVQLLSLDQHCELPEKPAFSTSVVIPCYNVDSTILTTLGSIAAQDLPDTWLRNLEVILVDDGSKVPLERSLNGKEFGFQTRLIRLSENHGVSHARAMGVAESRGEILIFIDGDVVLSKHYLRDHLVRNLIIDNAVFVSFKENVSPEDSRLSPDAIAKGSDLPDYSGDLRIARPLGPGTDGQAIAGKSEVRFLEETNYFKSFHGSRVIANRGLPNMVYGHNCSARRELVTAAAPFDRRFIGWGREDAYFGLRMVSAGNFIIPVLSSGVLHVDHPPRSGSLEAKERELKSNIELLERLLDELA